MLSGPAAALHTAKREGGLDTTSIPAAWAAARAAHATPFLIATVDKAGKVLSVTSSGDGGLHALRAALDSRAVQFCAFAFYAGDDASRLQRAAFVSSIGGEVGAIARGRVSLLKGGAAAAFAGTSAELHWAGTDGTSDAAVIETLARQCGKAVALLP